MNWFALLIAVSGLSLLTAATLNDDWRVGPVTDATGTALRLDTKKRVFVRLIDVQVRYGLVAATVCNKEKRCQQVRASDIASKGRVHAGTAMLSIATGSLYYGGLGVAGATLLSLLLLLFSRNLYFPKLCIGCLLMLIGMFGLAATTWTGYESLKFGWAFWGYLGGAALTIVGTGWAVSVSDIQRVTKVSAALLADDVKKRGSDDGDREAAESVLTSAGRRGSAIDLSSMMEEQDAPKRSVRATQRRSDPPAERNRTDPRKTAPRRPKPEVTKSVASTNEGTTPFVAASETDETSGWEQHVVKKAEITPLGLRVQLPMRLRSQLQWGQFERVAVRQLPSAAPYNGKVFLDLLPQSGGSRVQPLRLAASSLLNYDTLSEEESSGYQANFRRLVKFIQEKNPRVELDAATVGYIEHDGPAYQLKTPADLANYDKRFR